MLILSIFADLLDSQGHNNTRKMLNMKEMSIFRESITYDDLEVNYPGRFKKSTWEANTLKDKDNQKVRMFEYLEMEWPSALNVV